MQPTHDCMIATPQHFCTPELVRCYKKIPKDAKEKNAHAYKPQTQKPQ